MDTNGPSRTKKGHEDLLKHKNKVMIIAYTEKVEAEDKTN